MKSQNYSQVQNFGTPKTKKFSRIAVVCCSHGNERYGIEVGKKLHLPFFLANKRAFEANKRFIDADLNRSFPGNINGNKEEKIACHLLQKLKKFDYVIDLHSSSNSCPLFGIITSPNKEKIEFAKRLGLKKLIIMPEFFGTGKSLIDFVKCGISLEIGPHKREENIKEVKEAIDNLISNKYTTDNLEIFEIFSTVKKQSDDDSIFIENFKEVKKGEIIAQGKDNKQFAEFDFIPVFVNEEAYKGILCLAAKRIKNIFKHKNHHNRMNKFKVTPWEVSGDIDYERLMKEFGISALKELPEIFNKEIFFRRKIVFAHRDIQKILEAVKNKHKFVMMTGLMPTGKFHIGHMLLAQQMIFYQKLGAKIYIAVADIEAYNTRSQGLEESRKIAIEQYITNYIALGLKPENCEIYFQSSRSNNAKKSNAYYRLQNLLARHATFNEFKAVYGDITPGKMMSALLQAADMLHPQLKEFEGICPVIVPVGVDQDPHIRLARDISQRIKDLRLMQLSSTYHFFAPGLGGGKMSASEPNSYIALTDTAQEVRKKINKYAFSGGQATIEEHRKKGGNPDVDISFQYLRMFFEPDDKKLEKIRQDYVSGKLLTGELKAMLIEKINAFLKRHQEGRKKAEKRVDSFILKDY